MAKSQARKRDNSIKIAIIIFVVFIVAVGTALIINNRAISYVATVDGQRIPISHFNYQFHTLLQDQQIWDLIGWFGWGVVEDAALNGMVELHTVVARAAELGVSLSSETTSEVTQYARNRFVEGGYSEIEFTRSSFVDFMLMMALYNEIYEHITSQYEVSEAVIADGLAEYMRENVAEYTSAFVFAVQVNTQEEANELFARFMEGENIADIVYEIGDVNEDGEPVVRNAENTHLDTLDFFDVLEMEVGEFTEVLELRGGFFGFFQVESIESEEPSEERIEALRLHIEMMARHDHFRNFADLWVSDVTVVRNERVLPYPSEEDWGWDLDWDLDDILDDSEIDG